MGSGCIREYFGEPDITPTVTRDLQTGGKHLPKYSVAPISIADYLFEETLNWFPFEVFIFWELFVLIVRGSCRPPWTLLCSLSNRRHKTSPFTPILLRAPEAIFCQKSNFCVVDSGRGLQSDIWTMGYTVRKLVDMLCFSITETSQNADFVSTAV